MDEFEQSEALDDSNELLDPKQQMKERRGKTLPVICILTMVNVGWMTISAIISLISGPASQEDIDEIKAQTMAGIEENSPEMVIRMIKDTVEYTELANEKTYMLAGINLLLAGLGFLAAFMMYKLKKTGFFIYLAYCAAAIAVPLITIPGNMISTIAALTVAFISAVFIILYAVQLKRME